MFCFSWTKINVSTPVQINLYLLFYELFVWQPGGHVVVPKPVKWCYRDDLRYTRGRFLSLARSKLRLCSANHRSGYWNNPPCHWPSTAWAYSEQETENGSWSILNHYLTHQNMDDTYNFWEILQFMKSEHLLFITFIHGVFVMLSFS